MSQFLKLPVFFLNGAVVETFMEGLLLHPRTTYQTMYAASGMKSRKYPNCVKFISTH
jgi:hypothetical protein